MITINRHPSRRDLTWFGVLLVPFFGVIGGVAHLRFGAPGAAAWIWGIGAGLCLAYFAVPAFRRPLYVGWIYAAFPIGWLVSHLVLAIMYYGVMTPIGLALRAFGRDPMHRRFDRDVATYWVDHRSPAGGASRYFRQF